MIIVVKPAGILGEAKIFINTAPGVIWKILMYKVR